MTLDDLKKWALPFSIHYDSWMPISDNTKPYPIIHATSMSYYGQIEKINKCFFYLYTFQVAVCIEKQMLSNGTRIFDDQNKYNILFDGYD
jgi:hypothetical protein